MSRCINRYVVAGHRTLTGFDLLWLPANSEHGLMWTVFGLQFFSKHGCAHSATFCHAFFFCSISCHNRLVACSKFVSFCTSTSTWASTSMFTNAVLFTFPRAISLISQTIETHRIHPLEFSTDCRIRWSLNTILSFLFCLNGTISFWIVQSNSCPHSVLISSIVNYILLFYFVLLGQSICFSALRATWSFRRLFNSFISILTLF